MGKGVKKIRCAEGLIFHSMSVAGKRVTIKPDQVVGFEIDPVNGWEKDTTAEDKKKAITWIRQESDRKTILKKLVIPANQKYTFTITKKLCGPYSYYIEASLSGKRDVREIGMYVSGFTPAKILSCKWRNGNSGPDMSKSLMLSYGGNVNLNIETEGLNGYKNLVIEIYRKQDDKLIHTQPSVEVIDGEIDVQITNTAIWQAKITKIQSTEEFYVQLKNPATSAYLADNKGSFMFSPFLPILNQQNISSLQLPNNTTPLKVGSTTVNASKPIACKYPEIEIIRSTATKTIFDEKATAKVVNITFPIISADFDDHKELVTLNLKGIKTNQCINSGKANAHVNNTFQVINQPENFKIKSKSQEKLQFETGFKYHPSNDNLAEKTSFNILEYIWPVNLPTDNNQTFKVRTSTCAYTNEIGIIVYPDVKWTLDFRFGMKGPEQLTHTNLPTYDRNKTPVEKKPNSRFSSTQEKALKAGRINRYGTGKKADGMELEFQLALKAEYNKGEELELAEKYAQKIKKFLNLLLSLKEGLDTLTNIDKVNAGHKSMVKGISGRLFKAPIIGTIDYPNLSVGGKWQAAINENNQVYTDGKLMLRFFPLLKGDVSLDIIAAASYVPIFGQVVKAVEIALSVGGAELNFLLTIFGQVNVEFEYALAQKGGSNLNLNGELGLKLVLSAKVKVSLNAVIFKVDGELQAEAYAVTSIKPKASIGHDKDGTYVEAKCDFMGINVVCIISAKIRNSTTQYKDTYNLLERKDEFVKGKGYIIS